MPLSWLQCLSVCVQAGGAASIKMEAGSSGGHVTIHEVTDSQTSPIDPLEPVGAMPPLDLFVSESHMHPLAQVSVSRLRVDLLRVAANTLYSTAV